jgi:hypothetical protein
MAKEYVEQRNGGYYILGTRVSLDSVVYAFLRGDCGFVPSLRHRAYLLAL